ncbi:hypothetical protein BDV27DRAFT_31766 [Aspergillus caelatus]|uniref:Uncharacterized protein n=1 Tax=Aspergillus caelatus TaxID=61420 RepID=A0A5N6ZW02_9EURO|nr:uncharacterized protein BDV27DRAFT_31766 [Aspergillus caelatus]KAE8361119.1 hypothetical protein BDV27DRAFT_31766 [Aspergillus caelatus]
MPSQLLQYLFGLQSLPLLASGLHTLLSPASAAQSQYLPLKDVSTGTIQAVSLSSLTLGTYYAIAAYQNNIPLMVATIPGWFLAAVVFYRTGEAAWRRVAPVEAVMGLGTALGLLFWGIEAHEWRPSWRE